MAEIAGDPLAGYAKCEAPPGRSGPWVLERFEVAPAGPGIKGSGPDCAQRLKAASSLVEVEIADDDPHYSYVDI